MVNRLQAAYSIRSIEDAHRQRWWTLAVLCLALTVIGLDNTILSVAIPTIVPELEASGSQLSWIIDSYTIVFACLLLTSGAVGDRFGRKYLLIAGLVVFGTFSFFAATAGSANTLIIARGAMGIGGALIFPTTLSILTNSFSGAERARAIGIWAGVSGIGVAAGPLLGGFLLEHFWWGSVFLINVPVCALAVITSHVVVPNSRNPEKHPLDPAGSVLSVIGMVGLLYAIIAAPEHGWTSPPVLGGAAVATVFLGGFIAWELHTTYPMLQVRFFKNPRFTAASSAITLSYFALFGSTFLITQYFQFVLGYSPLKSGFMTSAVAIGIMTVAPNAPRLVVRWGTKIVIVAGLALVAACLLLFMSDRIMSSLVAGWMVRLLYGAGIGLTTAPATESIMGTLPVGNAGVGSAVNDTTRQSGGALGIAVLGTIVASGYQHRFAEAAMHLPRQITEIATDSIGRAFGVSQSVLLPAGMGDEIRQIARDAYVASARAAYLFSAVVVMVAMFVTWKWLPARATSDINLDMAEAEGEHSTDGAPLNPDEVSIPSGNE